MAAPGSAARVTTIPIEDVRLDGDLAAACPLCEGQRSVDNELKVRAAGTCVFFIKAILEVA